MIILTEIKIVRTGLRAIFHYISIYKSRSVLRLFSNNAVSSTEWNGKK